MSVSFEANRSQEDSEDTRLAQAIEELTNLQLDLENKEPLDEERYRHCVAEIMACGENQEMCVSGTEIIGAEIDGIGHVTGAIIGNTQFDGRLYDVATTDHPEHPQIRCIGLRFITGTHRKSTLIEDTSVTHYAFAPVVSSSFSLVPKPEVVQPEPDDETAEIIDQCLLNEQPDFARLSQLITDTFHERTDLQRHFYMQYINGIATFGDISCLTEHVIGISNDGLFLTTYQEPVLVEGIFVEFLTLRETEDGPFTLTIQIAEEDETTSIIEVDTIQAIELHPALVSQTGSKRT